MGHLENGKQARRPRGPEMSATVVQDVTLKSDQHSGTSASAPQGQAPYANRAIASVGREPGPGTAQRSAAPQLV
jgi:hypothetical protein